MYRAFAQTQVDILWRADPDSLNGIGQRWSGENPADHPNARDWRTQASGLGAVLAAMPNPQPPTPPPTPPPTTPPPTPPPTETAWAAYQPYTAGDVATYANRRYRCRQSHTSLPGWEPPNTPALWLAI